MTATTASIEVRDYLAAVSRELADLPADERDDLLEDLDSHLHEVIAEGEGSLEQRLGPPAQYAAELTCVGRPLVVRPTQQQNVLHRAINSLSASSIWRQTAEHPWTRATFEFLAAVATCMVDCASLARGRHHRRSVPRSRLSRRRIFSGHSVVDLYRNSGLWPRGFAIQPVHRRRPAGDRDSDLDLTRPSLATRCDALARCRGQRRSRCAMWPRDFSAIGDGVDSFDTALIGYQPPGLVNNGNQVTNIYPYDAQGQPLDNVRLFDQDGQPLLSTNTFPDVAVNGVPVATAAPSADANEYPQPNTETIYGPDGQPTTAVLPRPNIVVPPLPNASATPPSPSPSATPSTPAATNSAPTSSQP